MASSVLTRTSTVVRPAQIADADDCGRIFFDAFAEIATRHNFPIEPSSPAFTAWKTADMLGNPGFYAAVAERAGRVVGSIFADERSSVVGVGPLSVDPLAQDSGAGRLLMRHVLERSEQRRAAGIRLVQTAYHYRSLGLYASLGFRVREPLSVLQGELRTADLRRGEVRAAGGSDLEACNDLCRRVHGHDRAGELSEAIAGGTATVVERDHQITGYATGIGYGWHAVGATSEDVIAMLSAAEAIGGLGVLVPSRNAELLQWALDHGLRIVQQSTLMTIGLYSEPAGAYLPSILF